MIVIILSSSQSPGNAPDPADRAVERERYRQRRELAQLTPRERRFLAFQAIGLSDDEMAEREQVSLRPVERQILLCRAATSPIDTERRDTLPG